ncbi:MAG: hypothetical protein ACYDGO_06740 [Smithellaceae bacterium]
MKTILSMFTAILCLGFLSTIANAGPITLPDREGGSPRTKTTLIQQPRKHLQTPSTKSQTPTRTNVRPVSKSTVPFKPLPNDDRKEIDDSMDP